MAGSGKSNKRERRLRTALFANSRQRMASYLPLAAAIQAAGHDCTLYHPPGIALSDGEVSGFEEVVTQEIATDEVRRIEGADVFLCSEAVAAVVPPGAVSVAIFHSLPDRTLLKTNYARWLAQRPTIVQGFDYVVAAVIQKPAHWDVAHYRPLVTGVCRPEDIADRAPDFGVIAGGYPKIEYLDRQLAGAGPLDTVIYCPTVSGNAESSVASHGSDILRALHQAFPNDRVVFRPYPRDNPDVIAAVMAGVSDLDRIVIDESVTGMDEQRRARLSVTDKSSAAITFALCSGRPAVFLEVPEPGQDEGFVPVAIGYKTWGLDGLRAAVQDAAHGDRDWPKLIHQARVDHLYRPFDPCAYLAGNLDLIARRGTREEWLSIPRFE